jgi:hypothetical protein
LIAQHWFGQPYDRAMVLLDNVGEVFDLPYRDRPSHGAADLVDRGLVSAAVAGFSANY